MSIGFLIAAIISGLAFVIHWLVGTGEVKRPLLDSAVANAPKYTLYLAWHAVTMMLFVMTFGFLWAAFDPAAWDVGAVLTGLAALCAIWCAVLQLGRGIAFKDLPQWTLFAGVTIAGLWSLLGESA